MQIISSILYMIPRVKWNSHTSSFSPTLPRGTFGSFINYTKYFLMLAFRLVPLGSDLDQDVPPKSSYERLSLWGARNYWERLESLRGGALSSSTLLTVCHEVIIHLHGLFLHDPLLSTGLNPWSPLCLYTQVNQTRLAPLYVISGACYSNGKPTHTPTWYGSGGCRCLPCWLLGPVFFKHFFILRSGIITAHLEWRRR